MYFSFLATIVTCLCVLAFLHIYWGFGGRWPGKDRQDLAQIVVGGTDVFPSLLSCLIVAFLLILSAVFIVLSQDIVPITFLDPVYSLWLSYAIASVFVLRGLGGFFESKLRKKIKGTKYEYNNIRIYSPLSLVLGISIFMLLI